jgi:hypothetical protein
VTTVIFASLSAVCYGVGVALQHWQAARMPAGLAGRPRLLGRLARRPRWLLGAALEGCGFGAHAIALSGGSLAEVQLILGCSLPVSVAVRSGLVRQALPRRCWPAILIVVAGIGAGVGLIGQGHPMGRPSPGQLGTAAAVTGALAVSIALACYAAGNARARPLLLAIAAGLADTSVAIVTIAVTGELRFGLAATISSWPLYALIAGGLASLVLTQTAYQADAPLTTLPVIAVVTPVASLAAGLAFLRDGTQLTGLRAIGLILCLGCAIAALSALARLTDGGDSGPAAPASPAGPGPVERVVTQRRNDARPEHLQRRHDLLMGLATQIEPADHVADAAAIAVVAQISNELVR